MSTKIKKLYSSTDFKEAKISSDRVMKCYSRKGERRKTVQVRISKKWHARLKEVATSEKMVLSFLLDDICKHFFQNYK